MASVMVFSRRCWPYYRGLSMCRPVASTSKLPRRQVLSAAASRGIAQSSSGAGKHWRYERIASVGLLAMIPAGLAFPNMLCDYGIAVLLPVHNHWGFESVIVDYVPKSLQSISKVLLYAITLGTFGGLLYLNYSDVGICRGVRMLWTLS